MHAGLIEETSWNLALNKRRVDSSVLRPVAVALGTPRRSALLCCVSGWRHKKEAAGRVKFKTIGFGLLCIDRSSR